VVGGGGGVVQFTFTFLKFELKTAQLAFNKFAILLFTNELKVIVLL
jgi:hypothetical protein